MGLVRTYVPTMLAIARRLDRYIERYDQTIKQNLSGERLTAFNTFRAALTSFIDANAGFIS